jgi:hypothetical protein
VATISGPPRTPAGRAAAWPAFYAVSVETLTFLFAIRGKNPSHVTAGTAWTKHGRAWVMSSWNVPTPRAWRLASRRPSTWPSEDRTGADRWRRETQGLSLTGQASANADTVLAEA